MNVPFVDLKAQYAQIRDEINPTIQEVIDQAFSELEGLRDIFRF